MLKQKQKLKELFYFYNNFKEFKENFNIIIPRCCSISGTAVIIYDDERAKLAKRINIQPKELRALHMTLYAIYAPGKQKR